MTVRPSHRELSKKLRDATALLRKGFVTILEPDVIIADAFELGYSFKKEFNSIFQELLDVITPDNYAGTRPPLRSYEAEIQGAELFAFVAESTLLDGITVYFKFALYNDTLVIVSLHKDRKEGNHG